MKKCVVAIVPIMYDPPSAHPRSRSARPYYYARNVPLVTVAHKHSITTLLVCTDHTYCYLAIKGCDPCRSLPND